MIKIEQSIDCVKMTRDIRDKLYDENKEKGLKEFTISLIDLVYRSNLWRET